MTRVFTNVDLLPTLLKVLPDVESVKLVVYSGEPSLAGVMDKIKGFRGGSETD